MEDFEKLHNTQNDRHHDQVHPCVDCVTIIIKQLTHDVYENVWPSIEKNISY